MSWVEQEARDVAGRWTDGGAGAKAVIDSLGGAKDDAARAALGSGKAKDTKAIHTDSEGRYSQDRKAVHEAIINHFLKGTKPQAQPRAIFTAGGAASGKSALAGRARDATANLPTPEGHVYINPDDIKAMLPESAAFQKAGRNDISAFATHEESSDIAKALTAIAMKQKRHIIVDGTGDSDVGKFGKKLRAASDAGYKVEARYAHVPVEEAIRREQLRAERTGRKVDERILRGQHKTVSRSYIRDVQKIPNETNPATGKPRDVTVKIYSTVNKGRPVLIASQQPGQANRILSRKKFADHVAKAGADQPVVSVRQDTPQQKAILRKNKAAQKVRKMYPPGTEVTSADHEGLPVGVVQHHIPHSNAQGGVLVVRWPNGRTGRHSPISLRKV